MFHFILTQRIFSQSKTYDSVTDKFMDFSFEKTNSAYMLFYERCPASEASDGSSAAFETNLLGNNNNHQQQQQQQQLQSACSSTSGATFELSRELADWIWEDNMHFIQAKNIFEHTYFK